MQSEAPWLVADIGGTYARYALVHGGGPTIDEVASLHCADYAGPQEALRAYLDRAGVACPRVAAIAVAAPVLGDAIRLTNSAWEFSRAALQRALRLERLLVINDFAALVRALPALEAAERTGRTNENRGPCSVFSSHTRPSCAVTIILQIARPSPVPP